MIPGSASGGSSNRIPAGSCTHGGPFQHQRDEVLTQLARDTLGLGSLTEIADRAAEAESRSHYASVRYQPEYARAQDQREGFYRDQGAETRTGV